MNQQFKELREQALREVDYLLQTEGSENGAVMYREHLDMVNQRFAELIVRECAEIARVFSVEGVEYDGGDAIREHFGVER